MGIITFRGVVMTFRAFAHCELLQNGFKTCVYEYLRSMLMYLDLARYTLASYTCTLLCNIMVQAIDEFFLFICQAYCRQALANRQKGSHYELKRNESNNDGCNIPCTCILLYKHGRWAFCGRTVFERCDRSLNLFVDVPLG